MAAVAFYLLSLPVARNARANDDRSDQRSASDRGFSNYRATAMRDCVLGLSAKEERASYICVVALACVGDRAQRELC